MRIQFSLCALFLIVSLVIKPGLGLYFYLEGSEQKCFIDELPRDTLVVGEYTEFYTPYPGAESRNYWRCTYKAEEWSETQQQFVENPQLGIQITVEELPQGHRIINQKGPSRGRFTFTAAESGEHAICLSTNSTTWFSNTQTKLHLDMVIGETTSEEENDKEHFSDLAQRVRELNNRVADIRREQSYQREREAEFRDQSEITNSRVVYWTIAQMIVLGITCLWQMRHLKNFFEAKKLV
ncbi:16819_t:CDS:2 [Acaulospora morrowiae]|uniref:16819_t:CDS:1 n=1 Tax=Acaulospora morrowiae TaxID=94023 RepID=A0A9N8VB58_9GLOM|nr:16819_t:CDS:2 [Acaulospora morrowiae]